jgi:cell division protein FtsW
VLWPTCLLAPLVLIEPDLGTALFLAGGTLVAAYLGGWPWTRFAWGASLLVPASASLLLLKPYQQRRIIGFLETWSDFDAAPYQIKQSLVTLGSGGWTGEGLGKGWQKLSFLPEANTDFVFAVIGEELGLVGTLGLVAVWCGLYVSGVRILSVHDIRSYRFLAGVTLLTQLAVQALLNVAVVTAMVPPKGISHPLVSAGGSNLVVSLMMLGIVWGLSRPTAP